MAEVYESATESARGTLAKLARVVTDLTAQSASALARAIRRREVSSREVVAAHLRRIAEVNDRLRAVVQLRAEEALREATLADARLVAGDVVGPLHGVPFTVKDWIETNDLPCAAGMEERRDFVPGRDATAVARLRAAGAILLGKTKPGLVEDVYPIARNPHDLARSPGASSGGEAAIIAAGGSPLGLGSDSGGSLRWPAHCCGVGTIKPTTGLVPLTGHFPRIGPMSDPRTVIGPIARSVEDLTLALGLVAGVDFRDPSVIPVPLGDPGSVSLTGMRVAWFTSMPGASPGAAASAAVESAIRALAGSGALVEQAAPPGLDQSLPISIAYWKRVESAELGRWAPDRPNQLSGEENERLLFEWDHFRRQMLAFMAGYELIVCPVATGAAPALDVPVDAATYLYTLPFSLTGQPVVVVRAGTEDGMPVGVQVVGRHWQDATVLAAARVIEHAAAGWPAPEL